MTKEINLSYDIVRKRVFTNDTYDYLEFPVSTFCIMITSLKITSLMNICLSMRYTKSKMINGIKSD